MDGGDRWGTWGVMTYENMKHPKSPAAENASVPPMDSRDHDQLSRMAWPTNRRPPADGHPAMMPYAPSKDGGTTKNDGAGGLGFPEVPFPPGPACVVPCTV